MRGALAPGGSKYEAVAWCVGTGFGGVATLASRLFEGHLSHSILTN